MILSLVTQNRDEYLVSLPVSCGNPFARDVNIVRYALAFFRGARLSNRLSIAARCALAAYDYLAALICAAVFSCALAVPAYAYVDPSVMTYTVQAIAGVAVALGAVLGVAFRRGRKAIMNAFHIDEDARKEKEGAVHRLDDQKQPVLTEAEVLAAEQGKPSGKRKNKKGQHTAAGLKWSSRLWRSCLASILLVGTVFLVAPAEMVAANAESLAFTLANVWNPLLANACAVAVLVAFVMSLFWGKGFDLVFSLVVAVSLCFYLQAMVFNQTLPAADGSAFYLEDHMEIAIASSIAMVAILIGTVVLFAALRFPNRIFGLFVCVALIVVQGAAVASLFVDSSNTVESDTETSSTSTTAVGNAIITREGLFELSPKNNVVILVLDAFDVIDLDDMMDRDPDVFSEMGGFTYFSNSTGSSVPTRYGLPYLLTGSWPRANETWDAYLDRRYTSSTFLDDILKRGYSLYVYTDTLGRGGLDYLDGRATNIHTVDETRTLTSSSFNMDGALRMVYRMALYRDMPWVAKEPFWFYTDEVNRAAYDVEVFEEEVEVSGRVGGDTPYIIDDAAFYKQLKNRKLSIYDDGAKGSVHFIHLFGVHTPYSLDENAQRIGDQESTYYNRVQQTKGELVIVNEYLRQMKALGVYDSSTIIITADHGLWMWEDTIEQSEWEGDMAGGPIMLVKPAGTAAQSAQPCKVSEARTGHIDYPATVIDAVGGNAAKYGITVFQANDPDRVRTYIWPTHDGTYDLTFYEYEIDGEVSEWSSWKRTGVEWPFNKPARSTL